MDNINFIPANDLPVAEGDEVSVLCLEDGEMKQKPVSGLGGAEYDIVVRIVTSLDEEAGYVSATAEIISGSFDAIVQKIDAGIIPSGLVIQNGTIWGGKEVKMVDEFLPLWCKFPDKDDACIGVEGWDVWGYLYADGTFEVD